MRMSAAPDRAVRYTENNPAAVDRDLIADPECLEDLELADDGLFATEVPVDTLTGEDVEGPGRGGD